MIKQINKEPAYKTEAPPYLREFLDYIAVIKGRSANTVKSYFEDLKLFLRFLKIKNNLVDKSCNFGDIKVNDLSEDFIKKVSLYDVMEFLHFMANERNNMPKARARRAVSIRQFYKFLTDNKMWFTVSPIDKLQLPSPKKTLPKHLTVEQSVRLLNTANIGNTRDYCILTLFINCGMRLNELVKLNVNDFTEEYNEMTGERTHLVKVTGKGSKERIIYLNEACVSVYKAYLKDRNEITEKHKLKSENAMFLSKQNRRISDRRIQQIIIEMLKNSDLDGLGISVHKLRHTAATLMYQNGVDVRVLKEVLGHENLNTTEIYTHVANTQLKKAMDKNPLAGFKAEENESK